MNPRQSPAQAPQRDWDLVLPRRQRIFTPDTLIRASHFHYDLVEGERSARDKRIPNLVRAVRLVAKVEGEARRWYRSTFDRPFDPCQLRGTLDETASFFTRHPSFARALEILNVDGDGRRSIQLPWWNELALVETGYERTRRGIRSSVKVEHSYTVQQIRSGSNPQGLATVSLAGVLTTAPVRRGDPGCVVIGVRGGEKFPNTFHVFAGTAQYLPPLSHAGSSLLNLFDQTELREELGLPIGSYSIKPLARFVDSGLVPLPGDVNYCFHVKSTLTFEEVKRCWMSERPVDRSEHRELVAIPNTREAILGFIERNYWGPSQNDRDRTREKAELLHPAALALAGYAGIDLTVLEGLASRRSAQSQPAGALIPARCAS